MKKSKLNIETKLDALAEAALETVTIENCPGSVKREVLKKSYIDYRNDILKELRRLYRCEKKLQEVAAL